MMDCLDVINIQHLRSLEQGKDILANHPRPEADNTGEPPNKKLATEAGVETSNGGASSIEHADINQLVTSCNQMVINITKWL